MFEDRMSVTGIDPASGQYIQAYIDPQTGLFSLGETTKEENVEAMQLLKERIDKLEKDIERLKEDHIYDEANGDSLYIDGVRIRFADAISDIFNNLKMTYKLVPRDPEGKE